MAFSRVPVPLLFVRVLSALLSHILMCDNYIWSQLVLNAGLYEVICGLNFSVNEELTVWDWITAWIRFLTQLISRHSLSVFSLHFSLY